MRRNVLLLAVVLLLGYLATGMYQVRPGEQAVVRRFGQVLDKPRLPGLNVGLPWGLDRVDKVAVDEQRQFSVGYQETDEAVLEAVPSGQVLTGDNHLIDVRATVYYRVERENPAAVVQYVLNADRIESFLARAAEVALASMLAGQRVDAVLLGQAKNLEPLIQAQLIRTIRDYQLGVTIESVNLTYVQPPGELAEVFREVNRARTQKEIAEREALGEKQTLLSQARTDAQKTRTSAQVDHNQKLMQARAEAHSFLALWQKYRDYSSDPQNALLNLYLTEMQTILSRLQVRTLSDQNVDQTIFVPLPEK